METSRCGAERYGTGGLTGPSRRFRLVWTSWWLASALFAATSSLRAQEFPVAAQSRKRHPPTPSTSSLLRQRTTSNSQSRRPASSSPSSSALAVAGSGCGRGTASLHATNRERHIDYELTLEVRRSGVYKLSSANNGARIAGAIAGGAGPIAIIAGAFIVVRALVLRNECDAPSSSKSSSAAIGLSLFLVGVVATPIGWSIYADNGPHLEAVGENSRVCAQPRGPPPLRVGLLPLPHGGGWGLGLYDGILTA